MIKDLTIGTFFSTVLSIVENNKHLFSDTFIQTFREEYMKILEDGESQMIMKVDELDIAKIFKFIVNISIKEIF